MAHKVAELCKKFSELIESASNPHAEFARIDAMDSYGADSLIFVSDAAGLPAEDAVHPAVIVTSESLASKVSGDCAVLVAKDVRLAQALLKQHYQDYDARDIEWPKIHPSAVIHSSASLHYSVRVGPNTVIGEGVRIGANTLIRANVVIERFAQIGSDCIINNLVNIGQHCQLGQRVIVRPGAIIGNEGFGFAPNAKRQYQRLPHTGIVVIEDDVQVGSNCNIDRGTYGQTLIKRGVKIDALCHIGHNCIVDEDALFVAQSGVAGSCRIGKRVISSGQTGMLDHKTVADDAILVHRCGVTEDIPTAGTWAGTPPKPLKEYVRNLGATKRIEKLEKELKALKQRLQESPD